MGAMNSAGFTSQLNSGQLPSPDHITYEGVFNELAFSIGPKAEQPLELHIGFCRAQNSASLVDPSPQNYLALFTKGGNDGQPRNERALNAVIILDISGSMSGGLSRANSSGKSRLDLSKEAIKMFVSKLRAGDSFGLVTFNNSGVTVVPCARKESFDVNVLFALVDSIRTSGGTTLKSGFDEGERCLRTYLESAAKGDSSENRLVMLTDVCDNEGINPAFIAKVGESDIHTTVIGISEEFQSATCERLVEFRGFNYFCAVEDEHLKKYLFECFDYTFFPANYDVRIELESTNVACFQVFGTPDSKRVAEYNNFAAKGAGKYTVTQYKSSFPSELEYKDGQVLTHGGLILVKVTPREPQSSFKAHVRLSYRTYRGEERHQDYPVSYELPSQEQFYSEECLAEAMRAYYFVSEMKHILEQAEHAESREQNDSKKTLEALEGLKALAPESKKGEVDKLIGIVKEIDSAFTPAATIK